MNLRPRHRRALGLVFAGVLVAGLTGPAAATQALIDDVELEGGNSTLFDPDNDEPGNDDCLHVDVLDKDAYTPVDDGESANDSDAYDGGMILYVNNRQFVDNNDQGNEVGEQLQVGPSRLSGVKVTRTDRALATSPTMRDLISFKNGTRRSIVLQVRIESDYGADGDEVVRASSTGPDLSFQINDRWLLVADDAAAPSDALVTNAWYGKNARKKLVNVTNDVPNADSCLGVSYRITIPAKSTRHLLLFAQLADATDFTAARNRAQNSFDRNRLPAPLLVGLSNGVKNNVLNWNL